ncbi:DUF1810 domain-containing protein [Sulfuriroseicoccus oceanibius]|uniref:DUF1810 domain-containing protein n=1 Tax=Sulfuriroseicoccus oceanibius TaxID=2707525 RepID=A0A6B3L5R6_9BACT|nr:DUF1810 domain-containing protein [Sulfuriroseicoccus oceanibius]QQL45245.1 DUF1810 domain-containing protein [Sulfuriroseicoccus oceanibius]
MHSHPLLQRFIDAQESDYATALAELRNGQKQSHWIWYIFPQVAGLGFSSMAQHFAIQSHAEATEFLNHPTLGARLIECTDALLEHRGTPIETIMGYPDDLKLRSSMTLFAAISDNDSPFHQVLNAFYQGKPDDKTLAFLEDH